MLDSIVAFVLNSTASWGRNVVVKRLIDGDAIDRVICNAIEGDSSKIRRHLEAAARKDLLNSIDNFNEGIGSISQTSQAGASEEDGPPPKRRKIEVGPQIEAVDGKMIKDKANLSTYTKSKLKTAREAAGSALNNAALKVEERILAANIKVLAQLLEDEDSTTAFGVCIYNLTKLNSLKAVSNNLQTEIEALRILSPNKLKSSRKGRDIIWCVCRLNRFVFDMAQEVGVAAESQKLFIWPCIEIGKGKEEIDPLRDCRLDKIFGKDKKERESCSVIWSFGQKCAEEQHKLKSPRRIVTNAQEQFLVLDDIEIKVFDNSGRYLKSLPLSTQYRAVDVDTDQSGNVYVLVSTINGQDGEIHVFDTNGEAKLHDFRLARKTYTECKLAVTQSGEVLILRRKSWHQNAKVEVYKTKNGMFQFASNLGENDLMNAQDIVCATHGHIFVLDAIHPASKTKYIHEFNKTSHRHLRKFEVTSNSFAIAFHRASSHLVIASSNAENLLLSLCACTQGKLEAKREYKLNETGIVSNRSPSITVTPKGRIVVALSKRLGRETQGKVIVY